MLSPDVLLSFFGLAVLLALAPGPDNLFVLAQSMAAGPRAGLCVVAGLCLGLVGHTAAVAAGLATLLAGAPGAFTALRLLGAAYLLYLAWGALRAPVMPLSRAPSLDGWALVRRGIVMNLSNPKVTLFFLALLPQFTSPLRGSVALQTLQLGLTFMAATLLVFGAIAGLAGHVGNRLRARPSVQRWLNRLAALVFVALALRLALDPG